MNRKIVNKLYSNLDSLIINSGLTDKFIILFGANEPAEITISFLKSRNIQVNAIIDNDPFRQNKTLCGVQIYKPDDLLRDSNDNMIILIASMYYPQMRSSIAKYNLAETQIVETLYFHEYSLKPEIFQKNADIVIDGLNVYDRIKKTYGHDVYIILVPCPSLGDTYFTLSYIDEYLKRYGLRDYLIVVSGGGAAKVAEIFSVSNCINISQDDNDALLALYTFMGLPDVMVVSHNFPYSRLVASSIGLELLNWGEMIREVILGLDANAAKRIPDKPALMKDKIYFENNGLKTGKTALLAPIAMHAQSLPDTFWSILIKKLNDVGYVVRLNVAENESVNLEGAEPLFVPLDAAIPFIEAAGVFIALRNGLCDVLCEASAKKIVIYPDEDYFNFFGIKNIGLSDSFTEIVYENDNKTIEHIMEHLES